MWLVGVVLRRYIDILIIIITFPYSTCIWSFFGSSILTSLFIFNFFRSFLLHFRIPFTASIFWPHAGSCVAAGYTDCCVGYSCTGHKHDCYCSQSCHIYSDCCHDINTTCPYKTCMYLVHKVSPCCCCVVSAWSVCLSAFYQCLNINNKTEKHLKNEQTRKNATAKKRPNTSGVYREN